MGSKKVKKKVKVKRLGKLVKSKKCRLNGKNHSLDVDECHSLETFSQIRKNYFNYLQNVIKENFESVDNKNLSVDELERISLEIEQQALLACMQSDVYQKEMIKFIHDIRKSTRKMKLNLGVRAVIKSNNFKTSEISERLKSEERDSGCGATEERTVEVYSQIPTISSIRTNYNEYDQTWTNNSAVNEYSDVGVTPVNSFMCENNILQEANHDDNIPASCEAQDVVQTDYPLANEHYLSMCNCSSLSSSVSLTKKPGVNGIVSIPEDNNSYFPQNLVSLTSNSEESHGHNDVFTDGELTSESHVVDPISKSRNQLQKSIENSLKTLQEIKVQRKEEIERAKLVRLLEDDLDDEADETHNDWLSDNCDEPTAETNENADQEDNLLADRLEEMRQIFGMEDEEEMEEEGEEEAEEEKYRKEIRECTHTAEKGSGNPVRPRKPLKPNHTWYHERVIQMYRYSMLASEMTQEMRNLKKSLFLEFFGEDSDEENEINFQREEKYIMSCKERISSWVVKYLMPFYHRKKIIGRSVFKCLGHHVSNSIIERIKYPDEWTVKYLVTKFFPPNKIFIDESDISNFRID